ncbi:putative C2H2 zinc finger domain protein [Aspergillus vadensis CBS 113365]|uniref:C2H2-type domain-containing protein n=1 Tax=Aspergillus vadensis (strain CBS 113365 / IMI 142717 / IBT 24658) TaxID=1448311 RepID=A0A319BHG0_ASPVC|nr:hypothetical protein BO88DRAFT_418756 [Aspergillus vadensis CBS 113365]PYH65243.1 hypothetical protein BO88DRAFT_418756 [Aspergillus vadensis CBS 113365]
MGDDTGNGRNSFSQGNWPGFPPQSPQGNHLMPGVYPYPTSSHYSPSSPYSPVSTSRSISPIDGLHPDMNFLTDGLMNDIAGVHMANNGIQGLPVGDNDSLSLVVPTIPQAQGGMHANHLDSLLSQLATAVETKLPQQDAAHLYDMKAQLSSSHNRLIRMIQHQIDTIEYSSHSPGSSDSGSTHNGYNYVCKLCPNGKRNYYTERGSFRRHVSDQHHSEFRYLCLAYPNCRWSAYRRDKVYDHMRIKHKFFRASREQANRRRIRQTPPRQCGLCLQPVNCWAEYFTCVANHCRVRKAGSTNSSASQSRRGSDDRGGGHNNGPGFGGNFFPGGGFGQFGPHQFYPGNNGGFSSTGGGQNNGYYGNSFSGYRGATNRDDEESTSGYSSGEADAVSDIAPSSSCCSSDVPHTLEVPVPSNITSQHLALMQMAERAESCDSVSHGEDCPPSTPGETDISNPGDKAYRRISRRSGNTDPIPKRSFRPKTEDRSEKRCQGCGHTFDDCDKCRRLKGTSFQCHLCTDSTCKLHAFERDLIGSREPESCKHPVDEGDLGVPAHPPWTHDWSLSPTEHSLEASSPCHYDRHTKPEEDHHLGAQKSPGGHTLGLGAFNDGEVHSGSPGSLGRDSPVGSEVTCSPISLDNSYCQALPSLDTKVPQEGIEAAHGYGSGKLMMTEELKQTLDMLSVAKSTYQSYEILSFCVLNAVQEFFDQMLVSWLVCEAALLKSVSLSYCIGGKGISGKQTESAISRRYLPYPWERMCYQSTARRTPRRKHSLLRTKLQVISGVLILRATVMRRKPLMSSSTDTSAEAEPSKIGTELQVLEPPSFEVMFSRGTEVVADAFSSLITGVMSATEEEMEYFKPLSAHFSNLFTRGSWLGDESLIE